MNMKQINEVLSNNNLTMNDVIKIANRFSQKDLSKEKELRNVIHEISKMLGKNITLEQENKMIEMVKNGDVKL